MADPASTTQVQRKVSANPLIGRLIAGRYRVIDRIGSGGMGSVYRAEQVSGGRPVALKILDISGPHDHNMDFAQRFLLEASVVTKLCHPNTVAVYDYGETEDGIYYMAMELLEGVTLRDEMLSHGPLSPQKTIHYAKQICRSLRQAHEHGVIHRDLKPANVFVVKRPGEDDTIKVLDFGLVKRLDEQATQITATGAFLGSPRYMAPEQISCANVGVRADIYALGVVMFEMLAGRTPFERETAASTMVAQLSEVAPIISEVNPHVDVPAELENVVQRCMAKKQEQRFADMDELLVALKAVDSPTSFHGHTIAMSRRPEPEPPIASAAFSRVAAETGSGSGAKAAVFAIAVVSAMLAALNPWEEAPSSDAAPTAVQPVPLVAPAEPTPLEHVSVPEGKVVVTLRSTPPGASVQVGDRIYGPTPVHIVLSGDNAVIGRPLDFHFSREGYMPYTVRQRVDSQKMVVDSGPLRAAGRVQP